MTNTSFCTIVEREATVIISPHPCGARGLAKLREHLRQEFASGTAVVVIDPDGMHVVTSDDDGQES